MSNPTDQTASSKADVNVLVRSEAAAVGEESPIEKAAQMLPPKEAVASVEAARDYAASTISSAVESASLPSTETLINTLEAAKQSTLLDTAKSADLSATGQRVVQHAEAVLDSAQRLLAEKAPHDEVQTALSEGAAAAAAVREALAQQADVTAVFGDDRERAQVAQNVEDTMRRAFDVTRALIQQQDLRTMLMDAANLAAEWVKAVSLASVHHAVSDVGERGRDVLAATGTTLEDQETASKAADKELQGAAQAREQLAHKLASLAESARAMALQLKDHPQMREAVNDLLHLFRDVTRRTWANVSAAASTDADASVPESMPSVAAVLDAPDVRAHAEAASESARQLIANFGGDLAGVHRALDQFAAAAKNEKPDVDALLDAADQWLSDADSVADEDKARRVYALASALMGEITAKAEDASAAVQDVAADPDSARRKGELRAALAQLFTESSTFLNSLRHDETAEEVQSHLQALVEALFIDPSTGAATVKPELVDDVRQLIPALVTALATLPVARVDVSTDEADVILDNLTLAAQVLPKDLRVVTDTHVAVDTGKTVTTIKVELRNLQVHVPDLVFYYYKKTFPTLTDVGIADVTINKLDLDLTAQPSLEPNKLLKVLASEAHVHDLVLNIKKARHNWLYTVLSPYVKRILSSRIESAVADAVRSGIESLDQAAERAAIAARSVPGAMTSLRESLPTIGAATAATTAATQQGTGGYLDTVKKTVSGAVESLTGAAPQSVEKEQ